MSLFQRKPGSLVKFSCWVLFATVFFLIIGLSPIPSHSGPVIEVFAGSVSMMVLEEAVSSFEKSTGSRVDMIFSGSGSALAQMRLARHGDLYIPASQQFMDIALEKGVVDRSSVVRLAYLVPAIGVAAGNPKGIHGLDDLLRSDVRFVMARPDTVSIGLFAAEIFDKNGLGKEARSRVSGFTESFAQEVQLLILGTADAIIGWSVLGNWDPDKLEVIPIQPSSVPRIAYISGAVSVYSKNPVLARGFLNYLAGEKGKAIFESHGYPTDVNDIRHMVTPAVTVGGRYELLDRWR
ncbi:MAG TPA: molybdate ABC transporter substrate-binding protein [Proteobacteria bacterium]|nr:putative binding protein precursor [bacterium BMS3Abin14]HDL52945.1 molybdate ABC transporter substrate-binding protein [Pseudomonadota bacterium]